MPYADPKSKVAIESGRRANRKHYYAHREQEITRSAKYNRDHKSIVNATSCERRSKRLKPEQVLYNNAKARARAKSIEFDLTLQDLLVPATCPVFGMPLVVATGCAKANSPSVDRTDPNKGYVRGNVRVISHKANTIKSNATLDEIKLLLRYMENL